MSINFLSWISEFPLLQKQSNFYCTSFSSLPFPLNSICHFSEKYFITYQNNEFIMYFCALLSMCPDIRIWILKHILSKQFCNLTWLF